MSMFTTTTRRAAAVTAGVLVAVGFTAPAAQASTNLVFEGRPATSEIGNLPMQNEPQVVVKSRAVSAEVHAKQAAEAAAAAAAAQEAAAAEAAAAQAVVQANSWNIPVGNYNLTARFGQKGPWARGWHTGLDFAGPTGQPVYAAKSGVVKEVAYEGAYGNTIVIEHANGYSTRYAHLNGAGNVSVGQSVAGGEQIGRLGSTGRSSGPHLHFEVMLNGEFLNPASVFSIASAR